MSKYDYSRDTLEKLVKESLSYCEVARKLGMKSTGSNYDTLRKHIKNLGISTEHFLGKAINRGKVFNRVDVEDYLNNSKPISSWKLKNKLLKNGLKENRCEVCGISEWNGRPISCQLHHINGDNTDNSLSNLQMLCPNCHSQTENFAGKKLRTTNKLDYINNTECNKRKDYYVGSRKVQRPSYEQFKREFEELNNNYCAMARKYGVSNNAIKKWIKFYEKYGM